VVRDIHERLPETHLVMHGSSSVPQELQNLINWHGGTMPQTWGVPVEEIVIGIRYGVRKINIDTDCRLAIAGQLRRIAAEQRAEFDPRAFLKPATAAMEALCAERYEAFGAAGQASRLKPVPLAAMAVSYRKGGLDPRTASGGARRSRRLRRLTEHPFSI
jgi:fructose-bisphosphate aldolase class II